MLLTLATLAILTFCIGIGIVGILLWRRGRGWRLIGGFLVLEALLAIAAQVALSTMPFGIGEPLIRVPFREIMLQTLGTVLVIGGVAGLVYVVARWLAARLPQGRSRRLAAAGLLVIVAFVYCAS